MSEKTVNLTLDNLKELFTHWADEMRKPAPPTPQQLAEIETAQADRLSNANSVKEKLARKRQERLYAPIGTIGKMAGPPTWFMSMTTITRARLGTSIAKNARSA